MKLKVFTRVQCNLRSVRKQVLAAPVKQSDIQGQLKALMTKMKVLVRKADDTSIAINNLKSMFVEAAPAGKLKVLQQIEDNIGIRSRAIEEYEEGRRLLAQMQASFGNNRAGLKVIREMKALLNKLEENVEAAKEVLYDMAWEQHPIVLSDEDDTMATLFEYVEKTLKEVGANYKPRPKFVDTWYNVGIDKPGIIRFGAFLEIRNMPILDGSRRTVYLAVTTNMSSIKNVKGSYGKQITGQFTPLKMYATNDIVDPNRLIENAGYEIRSYKSIERTVTYYAQMFNWAIFSNNLKEDPNVRLEKLASNLSILGNKGVKLKVQWPDAMVRIPNKFIRKDASGAIDPKWWNAMFIDMKRILDLPAVGQPKYKIGDDMLKFESDKKGMRDSHIFKFKISAISPKISAKENKSYDNFEPPVYIEEDLHTLGDEDLSLKDLFRQAAKELSYDVNF